MANIANSEYGGVDMLDIDHALAKRYGAFASYHSDAFPVSIEYYGENPTEEFDRLLDQYVRPDCAVLDLGCGAGHTLCRLAPAVERIWGIDSNEELMAATHLRIEQLGLKNAFTVFGNSYDPVAMQALPHNSFDIVFSRRGPRFSANLVRTLHPGAIFIQEIVNTLDGYPLGEIFGRRPYTPINVSDQDVLLASYADMGLFPISAKAYYYEEFYRDREHLAAFLTQIGAMLTPWLLPKPFPRTPFNPHADDDALNLYVKHNTTAAGVRVLRQRTILVLRQVPAMS